MVRRLLNPPHPPGSPASPEGSQRPTHSQWLFSSAAMAENLPQWLRGDTVVYLTAVGLRFGAVAGYAPAYIPAAGQWSLKYQIQPITVKGRWSATWVLVWASEINKGTELFLKGTSDEHSAEAHRQAY